MQIVVNVLAVLLTSVVVGLSADLFRTVGVMFYSEQYLAGLLWPFGRSTVQLAFDSGRRATWRCRTVLRPRAHGGPV